VINSVRVSASAILTNTAGLGDVRYGVGEYKDVGDAFVYRTNTALTSSTAAVQTGINQWVASGGGDFPEANLYGLQQVANTTGWRAGSTRILVWFGDAPGTDPTSGVTEAVATAALVSKAIAVQALDVGLLNQTGQAVRIANATGGNYYSGVNTGSIVTIITNSITSAVTNYTTVGLDLSLVPAGLSVTAAPALFTGTYSRAVTRTFEFDVTFTALATGAYTFDIPVLVDKATVAKEVDSITVTGGEATPPSCSLIQVIAGPPKQLVIAVQDSDNGLASVEVTNSTNATVEVPAFTAGSKDPYAVIATKVDPAAGSVVALRVTDSAGNYIDCDPVVPGDDPGEFDASETGGGASCSMGTGSRDSGVASLIGGALLGLALLRRRRNAA
jgi:hypothetical protein